MYDIKIGRFNEDPEAQGVIRPADDSWQLVIDKEGLPHLYVRCKLDDCGEHESGLLCIDDLLPDGLSIREVMREGSFGGQLSEEEEQAAVAEYKASRERTPIPCPK